MYKSVTEHGQMHVCMQIWQCFSDDKQYRDEALWCDIEMLLSSARVRSAGLSARLIHLLIMTKTKIPSTRGILVFSFFSLKRIQEKHEAQKVSAENPGGNSE